MTTPSLRSRRLHSLAVLAAGVAGLALAPRLPWCAAAQGPVLGSRSSGIVDENKQVVGQGPALKLTGPAPAAPQAAPTDARERLMTALRWLKTFLDSVNDLEKDMVKIRAALRSGAVDIRELQDWLKDLRHTRDGAYTDNLRNYCDQSIMARLDDLRAVEHEQDDLIQGAQKRWDDLLSNLKDKIADSSDFPDFQRGLQALQATLAQKKQLADMELNLSAGNSDEFRRLANDAQQNPALQMPVLLMRIADFMDRGDGRGALYAARLGMERYPDNQAFSLFTQSLETSYLRMISTKAAGDGADIHKAWTDYSGTVSDSYVKQFFFGGLTRSLEWYAGKADALEQLQGAGADRGVMEHNGIELMLRLHDKGLSFDDIRGLSSDALKSKMSELFPQAPSLRPEEAQGLALSLRAALQNDDVQRLFKPNKQQFDVDLGRSYYGAEEFDQGILEYAVDAINVKNALLFLGPSAMVGATRTGGGLLARMASGMGAPEGVVGALSTELEGGMAVREWALARPTLQQAFGYVGGTRAGEVLKTGMEALRYLRYDAPGIVQFGTGLAEAGAQMVMFEAGGKIGHALGGDLGEFIGQALVTLAGNPIADLQAREVKAAESAAQQMAQTRQKWEAMNQVLKQVEAPVEAATKKLAAGGTLAADETAALATASATAKTVVADAAASAPGAGAGGTLIEGAGEQAQALDGAAQALQKGDGEAAEVANGVARDISSEETVRANTLKASEQELAATAGRNRTLRYGEAPPPAGGTQRAELDTWVASADQTVVADFREAPPPTPPTPPPAAGAPPTAAEAGKLGDEAMRARNFAEAAGHYQVAADNTIEELRAVNARKAQPGVDAGELQALEDREKQLQDALTAQRGRLREARQAARYEDALQSRARQNPAQIDALAKKADEALQPFSDATRQDLQTLTTESRTLDGSTKRVQDMSGTAGGPKKILGPDGELLGIWKPAAHPGGSGIQQMNADGQGIAEVVFSRLAQKLGLRVPHAEPMVLREVDAAGQVIAEHPGVISHYVPGSRALGTLTPGARAALKDQIASLRALSILTGNYDVHFNNYLIDKAGHVWGIDAGLAAIKDPSFAPLPQWVPAPASTQEADWARALRDFRSRGGDYTVARMDDLITRAELNDTVNKVKGLSDADLRMIVDSVMPGHADADAVLRTLKARRDGFEEILQDKWPSAPAPPAGHAWALPSLSGPEVWVLPLRPAAVWLDLAVLQRAA